jgi:hypothetical protein
MHHVNKDEITDIATLFKCYYRLSQIYTTVMFQMVQQKSNLVPVAIGMHRVKYMQASPVEIQARTH